MISDIMYPKTLILVNHFNQLANTYWSAMFSLKSQPDLHLPGFCAFIKAESKERWEISEDVAEFITGNKRPVVIEAAPKPKGDFNSPQQIIDYLAGLEDTTVKVIGGFIGEAIAAKDYNTEGYLKWLYKYCLKEQKEVNGISTALKMYSGDACALMMKDKELYDMYKD